MEQDRNGDSRRTAAPRVPPGDVWRDRDVAAFLHVCVRTVKRIANAGPRPGEIDLRMARPVTISNGRRWSAENVKALVSAGARKGEAQ